MRRRDFLRVSGAVGLGTWLSGGFWQGARAGAASVVAGPGPYGALQAADAQGIMLPPGFSSRVIAVGGSVVPGTGHTWHGFPDGGAVFPTADGWIYVSNAELPFGLGGVSAVRFDSAANIIGAYPILAGTSVNCAGGATPWGTWLSCEELETGASVGHVFECDPYGLSPAVMHPGMGGFSHEAVAVDPLNPTRMYLTEDQGNGGFYRFTSTTVGDLSSGLLEIAEVVPNGAGPDGTITWHAVPVPDPDVNGGDDPTRLQVPASTGFSGGEGIVWSRGLIYIATKGDNRVWQYDPADDSICVYYDAALDPGSQLSGVDNIGASRRGELFVAEDGGNMEIVVLSPEGEASPLLRILDQDSSEIAGPAFDPEERRLYLSSQRGGVGAGITYEITGPFRKLLACT